MRVWEISILLLVGLVALLLLASMASAVTVTDGTGDVYDGLLETFVSRPDIDITTITYELSWDTVTLSMTVEGNIVDSEYIGYTIWTNSTFTSGYVAQYRNGTGYVMKDMAFVDSEVSISQGNTIIFTFARSDLTGVGEIVGSAMENSEDPSQGWIDYAPDDYLWDSEDDDDDVTEDDDDDVTGDDDDEIVDDGDTGGNGDDDDDDKGIPGFETITIISAIGIALILLRRKK